MKLLPRSLWTVLVLTATAMGSGIAYGESSSHQVTYSIVATRTLSLSETGEIALGAVSRTQNSATASGGSVTYKTDSPSDKISAEISSGGPTASGVTLLVSASEPTCQSPTCEAADPGANNTNVDLSSGAERVVIDGIASVSGTQGSTTQLTYRLLTSGAVIAPQASKTITYTMQVTG
jgi:hypothetical protein